ncbi:apolipoprotein C-III-like [Lethenteron reissneri]|uniref:apolipoprotein C-III-like n=1 Tax=Lethenteron reissneri TaxID=7753 RepID=UPI002AB71E2C|nr:apolipoprotein C-III-like [Lethenteron reissneri]
MQMKVVAVAVVLVSMFVWAEARYAWDENVQAEEPDQVGQVRDLLISLMRSLTDKAQEGITQVQNNELAQQAGQQLKDGADAVTQYSRDFLSKLSEFWSTLGKQ